MLQNLNTNQSKVTEMGLGVQPDEILNLIDHIEGKFDQNNLEDEKAKEKLLNGVSVSPGVAVGHAIVIKNPEDLKRINQDSILICSSMSPIYSIAFQTVRAIICEQGGILSTAAAAARENGLPAVTGVRSARQIISDGDLIRIDGTNGSVQIKEMALENTV